ncbi:MAG: hypothetical protein ABJB98_03830 [Actinomycetota bacterium]
MRLRQVTDADLPSVGALLAASFHTDPAVVWRFPDTDARAVRTPTERAALRDASATVRW